MRSTIAILGTFVLLAGCTSPAPRVQWERETLVARCPVCKGAIAYRASRCNLCQGDVMWALPQIPNTPEGAFIRFKIGIMYRDQALFATSVVHDELREMVKSLTYPDDSLRRQFQELKLRDVKIHGEEAEGMLVGPRGEPVKIMSYREEGTWKLSFRKAATRGMEIRTQNMLRNIRSALEMYRENEKTYPPGRNAQLVQALSRRVDGIPYVDFRDSQMALNVMSELLDSWNNPIYYQGPAEGRAGYVLYSFGPNRKDEGGTGDDISGR